MGQLHGNLTFKPSIKIDAASIYGSPVKSAVLKLTLGSFRWSLLSRRGGNSPAWRFATPLDTTGTRGSTCAMCRSRARPVPPECSGAFQALALAPQQASTLWRCRCNMPESHLCSSARWSSGSRLRRCSPLQPRATLVRAAAPTPSTQWRWRCRHWSPRRRRPQRPVRPGAALDRRRVPAPEY